MSFHIKKNDSKSQYNKDKVKYPSNFAVGISSSFIKFFEKYFEPSIFACSFVGPNTCILFISFLR